MPCWTNENLLFPKEWIIDLWYSKQNGKRVTRLLADLSFLFLTASETETTVELERALSLMGAVKRSLWVDPRKGVNVWKDMEQPLDLCWRGRGRGCANLGTERDIVNVMVLRFANEKKKEVNVFEEMQKREETKSWKLKFTTHYTFNHTSRRIEREATNTQLTFPTNTTYSSFLFI